MGDLPTAIRLFTQVIDVRERAHGGDHPETGVTLQNRATALKQLGRLEEARADYERVAAIFRDHLATDNYRRGLPDLSLSALHLELGDPMAAEVATRASLEILETALPEGHYVAAIADCWLARSLVAQDRGAEAGSHFERSIEPLTATDQFPEYRAECLTAALEFYKLRGETEQVKKLEKALRDSGEDMSTTTSSGAKG